MTIQITLGAIGAAMTAAANSAQGLSPGKVWNMPAQAQYPTNQPNIGYAVPDQNAIPPPINWGAFLNNDIFLGDGPLVDSSDPQLSARIRVAERVLQRSNGRRCRDIARDIVALLDAMHLQEAFDLEGTIE